MRITPQTKKTGLRSGRDHSHESAFIRTGKISPATDLAKAKRIGERFLAVSWGKTKSHRKRSFPVPAFKHRISGRWHSSEDIQEMEKQIRFAVDVFSRHLPLNERKKVMKKVLKAASKQTLAIKNIISKKSVPASVRKKGREETAKWQRKEGVELFHTFRSKGRIYKGWIYENNGKFFIAPGWRQNQISRLAPIHETMHVLQKLGVIKVDVPFSEAIDRFYGLEQGIVEVKPEIKAPTKEDFDFKARVLETGKPTNYNEPEMSYVAGRRIGQWLHQNLSGAQGWTYLYSRCMGKNHAGALREAKRK